MKMDDTEVKAARILIVDDEPANVRLLERILEKAGHLNFRTTSDSREVLDMMRTFDPDLVLLDLHMPHVDGFRVMTEIQENVPEGEYLPILVLTADVAPAARQRALSSGAKDFLTKPVDPAEVVLRIYNLLETRFLHMRMQDHNQHLEEMVRARTWDLQEAQIEILERLARAAEYRDDDTGQHTIRVGRNSARLARAAGLSGNQVELIRSAAPLHDVGKIGIPDSILLKPGKLTDEEFARMKPHTTIGARILSGSSFALLKLAERIALAHHENWDGSGYPHGLSGEEIPLPARIVAIIDVFDALTHERPYKSAWPEHKALAEIGRCSGQKFDPRLVELFVDSRRQLRRQASQTAHAS